MSARKSRAPHRFDPDLQGHRLTVAYRGNRILGLAAQASKRTVQECLEAALKKLWSGREISLQGSGRTDTGVHALGQVASFNAPRLHSGPVLRRALNANLPRDVRVRQCRLVAPSFHARFDATGKTLPLSYLERSGAGPVHLGTPTGTCPGRSISPGCGGRRGRWWGSTISPPSPAIRLRAGGRPCAGCGAFPSRARGRP